MRVPPANSLTRRALMAAATGLINLAPVALPAFAATYTVIPTGSIAEKRSRLVEVEKLYKSNPEDPYIFGEKAQLESDIDVLKRNGEFTNKMAKDVASGAAVFPESFRVSVPNMNDAVRFWTGGCGALVLSTRRDASGANVTRVGFGPQSLRANDGAKFALELVETGKPSPVSVETSVLQYVQLAMPVFRLSQVMAYGGEIESAYGWTELTAPGGLPLRVHIDENRRDPFEFVALRTSDIKGAVKHYEGLGMQVVAEETAGTKLKLGGSYGIRRETKDAFEVDREPGAIQMSYGDPALTTGLLLLPPKKRGAKLSLGSPVPYQLGVVGQEPSAAAVVSPDGFKMEYAGAEAFESRLAAAVSGKEFSLSSADDPAEMKR